MLASLLIIGAFVLNQTKEVKVTFRLTSLDLASERDVFITGSAPGLGNWSPNKVKLRALGNHVWQAEVQVPDGSSLEYKYTLGSWDEEGSDAIGHPLPNFSTSAHDNAFIKDAIRFWTKRGRKISFPKTITGTVRYHLAMTAKNLAARDVVVWLPPDYDSKPNVRYPVLYMQDGQNVFDASTSSFGNEWKADETATQLIKQKIIQPLIIVGISSTPERTAEYSPGIKGQQYMDFVVKELKPFIDRTYRTEKARASTYVAGSSMGGIISLMLAWEHSNVFSAAICMSPAFLDPANKRVWDYPRDLRASPAKPQPLFLYIDNGGVGLDQVLQPGVDQMLEVLKSKGFKDDKSLVFVKAPRAKHNEADWAKRLPKAIELVMKNHPN